LFISTKNQELFFRGVLVLTMLSVFFLTLMKPSNLPHLEINDKLAHVMAFLVLIFLADYSYTASASKISKSFWLLLFGLLIEIAQYYTKWRTADWLDLVADFVGIILYWPLTPWIKKLIFWQ